MSDAHLLHVNLCDLHEKQNRYTAHTHTHTPFLVYFSAKKVDWSNIFNDRLVIQVILANIFSFCLLQW